MLCGHADHWNGSAWATVAANSWPGLSAVWGTSTSDVWAAGNAGAVVHWDGGSWALQETDVSGPARRKAHFD